MRYLSRISLRLARFLIAIIFAIAPSIASWWSGPVAIAAPNPQSAGVTSTLDAELRSFQGGTPNRVTVVPVPRPAMSVRTRGSGPVTATAGVSVFIEATRDIRADLRALGADARTRTASGIHTATVPVTAIDAVSQVPGVTRVSASLPVEPLLDKSLKAARIVDPDTGARLAAASGGDADGRGTIVAVVDTGIDFTHEDFLNSDGTTRIVALWDQTATGSGTAAISGTRGVSAYAYGIECTATQINSAIAGDSSACPQTDTNGHGTHVASTAGGNLGAAPKADLIIVKYSFRGTDSVDAWAWVIAKAAQLGKPVSINNSFGGHNYAHDGASAEDKALNDFSLLPGVALVVAAGNDGKTALHDSGVVVSSGTQIIPFTATGSGTTINVWYASTDNFTASITNGSAVSTTVAKKASAATVTVNGASATVYNCITAETTSGMCQLYISLTGISGTGWGIKLQRTSAAASSSTGKWDAWVSTGGGATFDSPDYRSTLGEPAVASGAITVGSWQSKKFWTPASQPGYMYSNGGSLQDAYSRFSSLGPTRDGRLKPEVSAPGEVINAALSRDALDEDPIRITVGEAGQPNGRLTIQGTSMASPHVAGIVALLFQANPTLTTAQVKSLLIGTNTSVKILKDSFTDTITGAGGVTDIPAETELRYAAGATGNTGLPAWNNRWGYGKVDFRASLASYVGANATATPASTRTVTATITSTRTMTSTPTVTKTMTPTPTPTSSPTFTATRTLVATRTNTATPTRTAAVAPSLTRTPSVTATRTATGTRTATLTPTAKPSRSPTRRP